MKQERKERLAYFYTELLPLLKEKYDIVEYGTFIKIKQSSCSFDYYPMGQKICKMVNNMKPNWRELSIKDFKRVFMG